MSGPRVLVCGGRDYGERSRDLVRFTPEWYRDAARVEAQETFLFDRLATMCGELDFSALIHGGQRGADRLAAKWANDHDIPSFEFKADWKKHDKAAGPIRNARMLTEGKPDLVIAFPGGRGTADMVKRAREAGIEVRQIA